MRCAHCIQPIDGIIDHSFCKEAVWLAMSGEFTRVQEALKKQYNAEREGETVEIREPIIRSASL